MNTKTHTLKHAYTHNQTCTHTHTYSNMHTQTHTQTQTHTLKHAQKYTDTHTHTHTHIQVIMYTNSLVHKMRNVKCLHFNHTKAIAHRQSTIIHEFPVTCSFTLTVGYSLGMVKIEAFDDPHQTVRGGHTDHTGSIVSLMACIFDLKKKFFM